MCNDKPPGTCSYRCYTPTRCDASVVKVLREFFSSHSEGVVCAYLFGSLARREARTDSDADIAVLYQATPPPTLDGLGLELSGDLERHLDRSVDLVVLETNRQLFDLLRKGGWLSSELTEAMRKMAGFCNIVVHGYQNVDLRILGDIVENHLDDLLAFVDAIRSRLRS